MDATRGDATLTPAECRSYDVARVALSECDRLQLERPPDPHTKSSFAKLRAGAWRIHDVRDLMELLRDRTLVFNGDSVTEQLTYALECSARAQFGAIRPLSKRVAAPELARRCTELLPLAAPPSACANVSACRRLTAEHVFPNAGTCRDVDLRNGRHFRTSFQARGFMVDQTNSTVIFRFSSIAASAHDCKGCIEEPAPGKGRCKVVDGCDFDKVPLPSHMSLMPAVGADAVVFNFGLHYSGAQSYQKHMTRLLREMADFGQEAGRAAKCVETAACVVARCSRHPPLISPLGVMRLLSAARRIRLHPVDPLPAAPVPT